MTAEWLDKPDFSQVYNEMETWSRIAFDYFKE
jgi:predicted NUDIX family phosphoesterase